MVPADCTHRNVTHQGVFFLRDASNKAFGLLSHTHSLSLKDDILHPQALRADTNLNQETESSWML